jgi:hypothetical protein
MPSASTSIRFRPHETADGVSVMLEPMVTQSVQFLPSHDRCSSTLSSPLRKRSSRSGPQRTLQCRKGVRHLGRESPPLRAVVRLLVEVVVAAAEKYVDQVRAKMSSLFALQEATLGPALNAPPRSSHSLHRGPCGDEVGDGVVGSSLAGPRGGVVPPAVARMIKKRRRRALRLRCPRSPPATSGAGC